MSACVCVRGVCVHECVRGVECTRAVEDIELPGGGGAAPYPPSSLPQLLLLSPAVSSTQPLPQGQWQVSPSPARHPLTPRVPLPYPLQMGPYPGTDSPNLGRSKVQWLSSSQQAPTQGSVRVAVLLGALGGQGRASSVSHPRGLRVWPCPCAWLSTQAPGTHWPFQAHHYQPVTHLGLSLSICTQVQ